MRRIQLGKPYENFLDKMVESGYYATATEVIRDALRDKMAELENNRIAAIHALLEEGERSLLEEGGIEYTPTLMKKIFEEAKKSTHEGSTAPTHVRPT